MEIAPRQEEILLKLETARKHYVAQIVRSRLHPDEFKELPDDFIAPVGQADWKLPPASPALKEFFELWKSGERNIAPASQGGAISAGKKKKKPRTNIVTEKEILNNVQSLPRTVPVQTFQFIQGLDKSLLNIPLRLAGGENPTFHYISSGELVDDNRSCSPFICGQRVSLYPWLSGHPHREGGPVTDCFGISYYPNFAVAALADGSSWGHTASQAANRAVSGFLHQIATERDILSTTQAIPQALLNGIATAHNTILASKSPNTDQMGTSTLLGGVLVRRDDQLGKWLFLCASVGDCKVFHLSMVTRKVTEITIGTDCFKDNKNDPGGAIGAIDSTQIQPDLRNLRLFSHPCDDGDIICMVSDGVHDNFNPKYLGIAPSELKLDSDDWTDVEDADGRRAVSPFILHSIENKILPDHCDPTPHKCTHLLLNNALETTQKSRDFMEHNPTKALPNDYSLFPGQLDYATCLSFSVGVYSHRHMESVNLWDYHEGVEEQLAKERDNIECNHPFSTNSPISVAVAESMEGVVIVCRTIGHGILRCNADETQVYLKLYRKPSTMIKLDQVSMNYKPLEDICEAHQPAERTIHLPLRIEPSSMHLTKDVSSGLYIIKFSRKLIQ